ncbi:hypothetical protein [Paenirhodobacter sp.]|uniref:DUF5927 domain-containing protein n=1 Tax=Paenirhodobacter sp. TaxID=1965326 RepID=UPI003B417F7C
MRRRGRAGLEMQSRFPGEGTRGPYTIFHGFTDLFPNFQRWLAQQMPGPVHGHLFAPERAEFADGATMAAGCLSDAAPLRDYNPRAFLRNLLWNAGGVEQCLMSSARDRPLIDWAVASDPNARIFVISGAWAVPLFRAGIPAASLRSTAARLQRTERQQLEILRSPHVRARVRIWTLAEAAADPAPLAEITDQPLPEPVDLAGLSGFLEDLRDAGMQPDFHVIEERGGAGRIG